MRDNFIQGQTLKGRRTQGVATMWVSTHHFLAASSKKSRKEMGIGTHKVSYSSLFTRAPRMRSGHSYTHLERASFHPRGEEVRSRSRRHALPTQPTLS